MVQDVNENKASRPLIFHLSRLVLFSFLLTFILARTVVFLIMSRTIPDLFMHVGGTHVHHLNYGIFLLSGVGGYLLFLRPVGRAADVAAVIYGIGMALTFDEFGMWLHMGGGYWQRASWDAVIVLGAVFGLIAFAPSLKRFQPRHWWSALVTVAVLIFFFLMLHNSFSYAGKKVAPKLHEIESNSPQ